MYVREYERVRRTVRVDLVSRHENQREDVQKIFRDLSDPLGTRKHLRRQERL